MDAGLSRRLGHHTVDRQLGEWDAQAARRSINRREPRYGSEGEAGRASIITSSRTAPTGTVNLLTYGGDTDAVFNTFVYGNAPAGVAQVRLTSSTWPASTPMAGPSGKATASLRHRTAVLDSASEVV